MRFRARLGVGHGARPIKRTPGSYSRSAAAQSRGGVDREIPNWRQINNDPQWIGWLSGTHLYSDRARQLHLDDAVASGSVHRVAQFFKDFIAQRDATQPRPAPPPPQWGSRASPRDKPIYSRNDITNASRAYMKGAYRGREAEYEALQADIVRATREGVSKIKAANMNAVVDRVGQKFGLLTVLARVPGRGSSGVIWRCQCACGREHHVDSDHCQGRGERIVKREGALIVA